MLSKLSFVLLIVLTITTGCSTNSCLKSQLPYSRSEVLFADDFSGDLSNWLAEGVEPKIIDGRMELDTPVGTTVWFRPQLSGNILIEYDAAVIDKNGPNQLNGHPGTIQHSVLETNSSGSESKQSHSAFPGEIGEKS